MKPETVERPSERHLRLVKLINNGVRLDKSDFIWMKAYGSILGRVAGRRARETYRDNQTVIGFGCSNK